MEVYVLDSELVPIAIIDHYQSLIWTKQYFTNGDFELYLPANPELLLYLKQDNYVMREDDDSLMMIESIKINTDLDNGDYYTISGRSLESILSRRVIWYQSNFINTKVSTIIYNLLSRNATTSNPQRQIPKLKVNTDYISTETNTMQVTYKNLQETIEDLCRTYKFGWRINKDYVFELYDGVDRTKSANGLVIFSPEFDNLLNSEYIEDMTEYKNVALVAGEGEGNLRYKQYLNNDKFNGLSRRELYVDARDLSTNSDEDIRDEYQNMMTQRGEEKLSENDVARTFDSEIDANITFKYKSDYSVGDIV